MHRYVNYRKNGWIITRADLRSKVVDLLRLRLELCGVSRDIEMLQVLC